MADKQLFEPEETEGKQVKEEVDPRLVTDKAKTCQTFRCRNLAEKDELRDAFDAYRVSRGKATVGEVIPASTPTASLAARPPWARSSPPSPRSSRERPAKRPRPSRLT